jgi:hypothetical protein
MKKRRAIVMVMGGVTYEQVVWNEAPTIVPTAEEAIVKLSGDETRERRQSLGGEAGDGR